MSLEQYRVLYSGTVQGVGFRYSTVRIAGGFDVCGYVRNLPNGQVECVVAGERAEVEAFLAAVDEGMGWCISERIRQLQPHSGQFTSFTVQL